MKFFKVPENPELPEKIYFTGDNKEQVLKFLKDKGFKFNDMTPEKLAHQVIFLNSSQHVLMIVKDECVFINTKGMVESMNSVDFLVNLCERNYKL